MNDQFSKEMKEMALPTGMLESLMEGYRSIFEAEGGVQILPNGVKPGKAGGVYVLRYGTVNRNVSALPYTSIKDLCEKRGVSTENAIRQTILAEMKKKVAERTNGTTLYRAMNEDDNLKRLCEMEYQRLKSGGVADASAEPKAEKENASKQATDEKKPASRTKPSANPGDGLPLDAGTHGLPQMGSVRVDDTGTMYVVEAPTRDLYVRFTTYSWESLKEHAAKTNRDLVDDLARKYNEILEPLVKNLSSDTANALWNWVSNEDHTAMKLAKLEKQRLENRYNLQRKDDTKAEQDEKPQAAEAQKPTEQKAAEQAKTDGKKSSGFAMLSDKTRGLFIVRADGKKVKIGWKHYGLNGDEAKIVAAYDKAMASNPNLKGMPEATRKQIAAEYGKKVAGWLKKSAAKKGKKVGAKESTADSSPSLTLAELYKHRDLATDPEKKKQLQAQIDKLEKQGIKPAEPSRTSANRPQEKDGTVIFSWSKLPITKKLRHESKDNIRLDTKYLETPIVSDEALKSALVNGSYVFNSKEDNANNLTIQRAAYQKGYDYVENMAKQVVGNKGKSEQGTKASNDGAVRASNVSGGASQESLSDEFQKASNTLDRARGMDPETRTNLAAMRAKINKNSSADEVNAFINAVNQAVA